MNVDQCLSALEATYLNKFRLAPEQKAEWRGALSGLSSAQLKTGMIEARCDFIEWPPNLVEFRLLCLRRDQNSAADDEKGLIEKWNKWARDPVTGRNFELHRPGESLEEYRRRLVWAEAKRVHNCNDEEMHAKVMANIAQNRANPGGWSRDDDRGYEQLA